jgi:hypothetical protein
MLDSKTLWAQEQTNSTHRRAKSESQSFTEHRRQGECSVNFVESLLHFVGKLNVAEPLVNATCLLKVAVVHIIVHLSRLKLDHRLTSARISLGRLSKSGITHSYGTWLPHSTCLRRRVRRPGVVVARRNTQVLQSRAQLTQDHQRQLSRVAPQFRSRPVRLQYSCQHQPRKTLCWPKHLQSANSPLSLPERRQNQPFATNRWSKQNQPQHQP